MSNLIPYKIAGIQGGESALALIYNFLNEPGLSEMSQLAIGGTFPVKDFNLRKECFGKQFWFCYDAAQKSSHQKVFLALEDSWKAWPRNLKESEFPKTPESDTLRKPSAPFAFDDKNYDRKDLGQIDQFIQSHTDANKTSKPISKNDVKKFSQALIKSFGGKKEKKEYCYHPIAYFENFEPESRICYIDNFLSSGNIEHVRYYFGLDTSKKHKANRIRVIVFPVSTDRKGIVMAEEGTSLLEKSVPPYS